MRNNQNFEKKLEEDICCPTKNCECVKCSEPQTCGEIAKTAWEAYLESEKCRVEPEVTFNICEYDPDQVYFMQYRSPRSLVNQTLGGNKILKK